MMNGMTSIRWAVVLMLAACGNSPAGDLPNDVAIGVDADMGGDLNPDLVGPDGSEPDQTEIVEVEWTNVAISLTVEESDLNVGDETEVEARVFSTDGAIPDTTPVLFSVAQGSGWLASAGIDTLQRGTENEIASTTFITDDGGEVVISASVELADDVTATVVAVINVEGRRIDPALVLEPDLAENNVFAAGSRRLPVRVMVIGFEDEPVAGVTVEFSVNAGDFSEEPDGDFVDDPELETDDLGEVQLYFEPGDFRGQIRMNATVQDDELGELRDSSSFQVVDAGTMTFVDIEYQRLGIQGSDYRESATVSFRLNDGLGRAVVDTPVTFEVDSRIDAVVEPSEVSSSETGLVTATVTSGDLPGPFAIVARATLDDVEIAGQNTGRLWVVSTLPVSRHSQLICTPGNIGGLVDGLPTEGWSATAHCVGELRDRTVEFVDVATEVRLVSEVGTTPETVTSTAGGTFEFDWVIDELPDEVAPFDYERDPEPAFATDDGEENIRDYVARVAFFVPGEEYFEDYNRNGTREGGEPFWDRGEPFVDRDDSGYRDADEDFWDATWGRADTWDDGNGIFDLDTLVWAEGVVVLSGAPSFAETPEGSDRETFSFWSDGDVIPEDSEHDLRDGGRAFIDLNLADEAGVPPNSSTNVHFELIGCGDSLTMDSDPIIWLDDELGFALTSSQQPVGTGWSIHSGIRNFTEGAEATVEIFNPLRGEIPDCELRANIEYSSCPTCDDVGELSTSIRLIQR